ncbi:MAG: lysostaphin resistance A-like protein [Erysipelotrichaceae bacterium]
MKPFSLIERRSALFMFFGIQILTGIGIAVWLVWEEMGLVQTSLSFTGLTALLMIVTNVILLIWFTKKAKLSQSAIFEASLIFKQKGFFKDLAYAVTSNVVLAISISSILTWITYQISPSFTIMQTNSMNETYLFANLSEYLLLFLNVAILVPFVEELVFRGVLFGRTWTKHPLTFAIIVSSLIFGASHGFYSIPSAFLFGVSACWVYVKYENLFASIYMHIANNAFAMLVMGLGFFTETAAPIITRTSVQEDMIMGLVLLPVGLLFFYLLRRNTKAYLSPYPVEALSEEALQELEESLQENLDSRSL